MEFNSPLTLLLLILLIPAGWFLVRPGRYASLKYSYLGRFAELSVSGKGIKYYGRFVLVVCRLLCIGLIIIALARPQEGKKVSLSSTKGVIMQVVLDRSSSMNELMEYNGAAVSRIDTAKSVLKDFIKGGNGLSGRPNDLIGLISFARYADTNCPLVQSPEILTDFLGEIQTASSQQEDGTAISDAIALAAARLNKAEVEIQERNDRLMAIAGDEGREGQPEFEISSKIIVLLTDGDQNCGEYNPPDAVEMAEKWGIKVYTVGIGGNLRQSNSIFDMMRVNNFNEKLLKWFASETGGEYSRADNGDELRAMFEKIDKLEKSEIQSISYDEYDEKYHEYGQAALGLLLLEIVLSSTIFRRIP